MLKGCTEFGPGTLDTKTWLSLEQQLFYVQGELNDPGTYARLASMLDGCALPEGSGHLFYLAIPPQLYPSTIAQLSASGVAPRTTGPTHKPYRRVLIEKPFGTSLESARTLNREVQAAFAEQQIYRIDHYLGKETVQNVLVFRFANSIFEPLWNRQHIASRADHGGRERGRRASRRLLRTGRRRARHVPEPPAAAAHARRRWSRRLTFSADAVRDEKVKVLRALRSPSPEEMHEYAVRGQYAAGIDRRQGRAGLPRGAGREPRLGTPTYAAVRFMVDNWRWQGVPFYLRSGKRLEPPHDRDRDPVPRAAASRCSRSASGEEIAPNVLVIRIQPEERIAIRFEVKMPGAGDDIRRVGAHGLRL